MQALYASIHPPVPFDAENSFLMGNIIGMQMRGLQSHLMEGACISSVFFWRFHRAVATCSVLYRLCTAGEAQGILPCQGWPLTCLI